MSHHPWKVEQWEDFYRRKAERADPDDLAPLDVMPGELAPETYEVLAAVEVNPAEVEGMKRSGIRICLGVAIEHRTGMECSLQGDCQGGEHAGMVTCHPDPDEECRRCR